MEDAYLSLRANCLNIAYKLTNAHRCSQDFHCGMHSGIVRAGNETKEPLSSDGTIQPQEKMIDTIRYHTKYRDTI